MCERKSGVCCFYRGHRVLFKQFQRERERERRGERERRERVRREERAHVGCCCRCVIIAAVVAVCCCAAPLKWGGQISKVHPKIGALKLGDFYWPNTTFSPLSEATVRKKVSAKKSCLRKRLDFLPSSRDHGLLLREFSGGNWGNHLAKERDCMTKKIPLSIFVKPESACAKI